MVPVQKCIESEVIRNFIILTRDRRWLQQLANNEQNTNTDECGAPTQMTYCSTLKDYVPKQKHNTSCFVNCCLQKMLFSFHTASETALSH